MKIDDIKPGTTYAATDGKRRTNSGDLPRRVKALEIVTVPKDFWTGGGYTGTREVRNVRQVKVLCLDEPRYRESYLHEYVMSAPEGTELVIEARFLAAAWSDVRSEVLLKISQDQAEADAKAETTRRINALLPKKLQDEWHPVSAHRAYRGKGTRVEARLEGEILETILTLAEKGAES